MYKVDDISTQLRIKENDVIIPKLPQNPLCSGRAELVPTGFPTTKYHKLGDS